MNSKRQELEGAVRRLLVSQRVQHSIAAQLLAQDDCARFIDAVKLENRLGNINPNCGNLYGGRLLFLLVR